MGQARYAALAALVVTAATATLTGVAEAQRNPAVIERIEPTSGPAGTVIQIVGRQFHDQTTAFIGQTALEIVARLPNRMSVRVPAGAQTGVISVRTPAGITVGPQFVVTAAAPAPAIQRIEPAAGAPGAEVMIYGSNFSSRPTENAVTLSGRPVVVRSATPFALTVIVPVGAATGPFVVRVAGAGEATSPQPFTVQVGTTITDFSPRVGPPGSQVTITGTGFSPRREQNRVYLSNTPMRVERSTATEIVVWVPAGAPSGPILVDVRGGGRVQTPAPFTVQQAPTFVAFEPSSGIPGRPVTIRGTNFGTDVRLVQVTLGGRPMTVRSVAQTQIVAEVPAGAVTGRIAVTINGVGPATSTTDFAVLVPLAIADFQPRSGPAGTEVTLHGQGFSTTVAENVATIAGVRAQVLSATPTDLRVRIPAAASAPIEVVVTNSGTARTSAPFVVTVPPFVAGFEPARGEPGTEVRIRGTSFGTQPGVVEVTLNGRPVTVRAVTDTLITVAIPPDAQSGPFAVTVRMQGASTSAARFEVIAPFAVSAIEPTRGPVGSQLTIRGVGFAPAGMRVELAPGRPAVVQFVSTAELRATVPAGAQTGPVAVRHPDGRAVASSTPFTVFVAPSISSFDPPRAVAGADVHVRGAGFGTVVANIQATIGGVAATARSVTDGDVVLVVPAAAVTGPIVVTVRDAGSATSRTNFEVQAPFSVTAVEPTTGAPGTPVVVRGVGFAQGARVSFGATVSPTNAFVSATELRTTVPANARPGAVAVSVRNADGRTAAAPAQFTISAPPTGVGITAIEPQCTRPGCVVVVRGWGFLTRVPQNRVYFGQTPVRVRAATPTELQLDLPVAPGTNPFRVDVRGVGVATSAPFTITP